MAFEWLSAVVMAAAINTQPAPQAVQRAHPAPAVAQTGDALAWTQIQFANSAARQTPPRWGRGGVCVGASGLSAEQAQFVNDRVSQRAQLLGLTVGQPGCAANLFIMFTTNPNQIAGEILQSRDYRGRGRARAGELQLANEFTNSRRPIRWWYVWQSLTDDGQVASHDERGNQGGPVGVRAPERGRLGRSTRQEFSNVFVVIDGTQIGQTNMNAVVDYVAMVGLAQVSYEVDSAGHSSILKLFTDPNPPTELTPWDVAQLREYYRAPQ